MAAGVPPPPLNSPSGSYYWLEWYTNLTNFLNGTNIPWSNINFTGSNLTDIQVRNHNDLQNIQGGPTGTGAAHWHMSGAQFVGAVSSTGAALNLPTGWTSSFGGGVYTITHGLGLNPLAYNVSVASSGGTGTVNFVNNTTNTFVVSLS